MLRNYPLLEKGLRKLKERYFVKTTARLQHLGDCAIYRSREVYGSAYCSCGFLHDLERILANHRLLEVMHPNYWQDWYLAEHPGVEYNSEENQQRIAESGRLLEEIFGKPKEPSIDSIRGEFETYAKLIFETFGNDFPDALRRLQEQYMEDIRRRQVNGTS